MTSHDRDTPKLPSIIDFILSACPEL